MRICVAIIFFLCSLLMLSGLDHMNKTFHKILEEVKEIKYKIK